MTTPKEAFSIGCYTLASQLIAESDAIPLALYCMLVAAVEHPEWAAWWVRNATNDATPEGTAVLGAKVVRLFPIEARDDAMAEASR